MLKPIYYTTNIFRVKDTPTNLDLQSKLRITNFSKWRLVVFYYITGARITCYYRCEHTIAYILLKANPTHLVLQPYPNSLHVTWQISSLVAYGVCHKRPSWMFCNSVYTKHSATWLRPVSRMCDKTTCPYRVFVSASQCGCRLIIVLSTDSGTGHVSASWATNQQRLLNSHLQRDTQRLDSFDLDFLTKRSIMIYFSHVLISDTNRLKCYVIEIPLIMKVVSSHGNWILKYVHSGIYLCCPDWLIILSILNLSL